MCIGTGAVYSRMLKILKNMKLANILDEMCEIIAKIEENQVKYRCD